MEKDKWIEELMDVLDGKTAATKKEAECIILERGGAPPFESFIQRVKQQVERQQNNET